MILLKLLMHVKDRTGGPSYRRVKGLVEAAFHAAEVPIRKGDLIGSGDPTARRLKSLHKNWFAPSFGSLRAPACKEAVTVSCKMAEKRHR